MADGLTGLPTHTELPLHLGDEGTLALLVDIDALIWLNDQFGHEAGDQAIKAVAGELHRLLKARHEDAQLYRVGGDEFLALLRPSSVDALEIAVEVVEQVRALEIPFRRNDRPAQTRLEVNVVVFQFSEVITAGLGTRGIPGELGHRLAALVYREKLLRSGEPGVVVDARSPSVGW